MSKFDLEIIGYFDQEGFIAEIYYNRDQWAEISIGAQGFIVRFYAASNNENWEFSLNEALSILEKAKNKLLKKTNKRRSLFPEPPSTPEEANHMGQKLLKEIIKHPKVQAYHNRFGGYDIFEPSGKGARFDKEENFMGFLQARKERS